MKKLNLNKLDMLFDGLFYTDSPVPVSTFRGKSVSVKNPKVTTHFENIDYHFCELLNRVKPDLIVGCMAWLTHPGIISHLEKFHVSIIIQKEEFLKTTNKKFKNLKCKYLSIINPILQRQDNPPRTIDPIRCLGVAKSKYGTRPNLHHKFLVLCKTKVVQKTSTSQRKKYEYEVSPKYVWTGSFNFTKNSCNSLENAIIIESELIGKQYFQEWKALYVLSESVDDFKKDVKTIKLTGK